MFLLTARRVIRKVFKDEFSVGYICKFLIITYRLLGYYSIHNQYTTSNFNYRTSLSIWFQQLFMLKPDASLMSGVPIAFKMHILLGFTIMACWPFTRLVHVSSIPDIYKSQIYYLP